MSTNIFFKSVKKEIHKIKSELTKLPEVNQSLSQFCKARQSDNIKRIYYLGITTNSNLGDWAQIYCIEKWLKDNYSDYEILKFYPHDVLNRIAGFIKHLKKIYKPGDIFVFESGYNINDMGCNHPQMHISIIKAFPDARILFMPATIYYSSKENMSRDANGYRKATNAFFLARDSRTQEIANEMMPKTPIMLFPDIVTTLIGTYKTPNINREGICICCRNDNEKYYSDQDYLELAKHYQELGMQVDFTDTFIENSYKEISKDIQAFLYRKIESFSKYKLIITDRFHGTVFSLIAGTPVIVVKTNNHKVIKTIEWFKNVYDDYVYLANSFEEVKSISESIMNKKFEHQLKPYFKEQYFDKLKGYVEKTLH